MSGAFLTKEYAMRMINEKDILENYLEGWVDHKELSHQIELLNRRIMAAKRAGYNIDVIQLEKDLIKWNDEETILQAIKDLRTDELRDYATNIIDNEEGFKPPTNVSPDNYSVIEQIEYILLQMGADKEVVFDVGELGDFGKRYVISLEPLASALYEVFHNTVNKAIRNGQEEALANYYMSVEPRLSEILGDWTSAQYIPESDILSEFTETTRLLNWDTPLTMDELSKYSDLYTYTDNITNYKE